MLDQKELQQILMLQLKPRDKGRYTPQEIAEALRAYLDWRRKNQAEGIPLDNDEGWLSEWLECRSLGHMNGIERPSLFSTHAPTEWPSL